MAVNRLDWLEYDRRREAAAVYNPTSPEEQNVINRQRAKEEAHHARVEADLQKHMSENGRYYTKTGWDASGQQVTRLYWEGTAADGSKVKPSLLKEARGKHTIDDFNAGTLDYTVDNYTKNFNKGAAFILKRNVAYGMTPEEAKLKEKMDADRAYKLAQFDAENEAPAGWKDRNKKPANPWLDPRSYDGSRLMNAKDIPAGDGRPYLEDYTGKFYDRSSNVIREHDIKADKRWKNADGTFASRQNETLYKLGVDKDDWDKADRAGRKEILRKLKEGDPVTSDRSRYLRSVMASHVIGPASRSSILEKDWTGGMTAAGRDYLKRTGQDLESIQMQSDQYMMDRLEAINVRSRLNTVNSLVGKDAEAAIYRKQQEQLRKNARLKYGVNYP